MSIIQKNNKILLKYFANILVRNNFIIIFMVFNILFLAILPLIFLMNTSNVNQVFKESSLLLIGIPMLLLVIFDGAAIVALFVKTKNNNVDLYIFIKPFKKSHITWTKELVIFIFSLHLIIGIILNTITLAIMKVNINTVIIMAVGSLISILIMSFIWISILTIFPIFWNFMTSLIGIFITILILILLGLLPLITQQSKAIETNFNLKENKNNLLKMYQLDQNNNLEAINYAIYENPLALNENQINGWKPSSLASYSPLNILWGAGPLIASSSISKNLTTEEILSANNRFAINYLDIEKTSLNDEFFQHNQVITAFSETNVLDFNSKTSLFSEIEKELLKNKQILNNINNNNFWSRTLNELKSRKIWQDTLSESNKVMLLHMMGLNSSTSILYSIFNNYELFELKLEGFYTYLGQKYNQDFATFIKYIWENKNVRLNVYAYQTLIDYKELKNYHPALKTYNEFEEADPYDVAFVKDRLFNIVTDSEDNIEKIKILNSAEIYRDLSSQNIFLTPVNTLTEFNDYIEQNSTINNLKALISTATNYAPDDVYDMEFRNNVENYYIISDQLKISEQETLKLQWVYIVAFFALGILIEFVKKQKIMKGDIL